jgi:copper chaperone CopZ
LKTINFQIYDLSDPGCISRITTALVYQKGVWDVRVLLGAGRVVVSYEEDLIGPESIKETILNIGFDVESCN